MAPRTRKSQRLQNSQASEGSNESHASLGHSMQMDITKVGVVGQDADLQHIGDPTPPQGNLTGKGKRTFGSLDDSPKIPATVPTPTPATKKARNVGPAHGQPMQLQLTSESEALRELPSTGAGVTRKVSPLSRRVLQPSSSSHRSRLYVFGQEPSFRPTHRNQDSYPTTEEDSANEDDIAALTQGNPSKFMASQIPSWLDPAFGARRRSSVSNTVRTGTSDNTSPSYTLPMPLPVPAGTTQGGGGTGKFDMTKQSMVCKGFGGCEVSQGIAQASAGHEVSYLVGRLGRERVGNESLRPRTSAACWGTQGSELLSSKVRGEKSTIRSPLCIAKEWGALDNRGILKREGESPG
ncbi:hypothetical protein EDB89DRAFT_1903630 [Lactarius sanguifluus]|nr:hypothetical protein EDB89DRAFT_1903630 [Lactarius sanguifluus]